MRVFSFDSSKCFIKDSFYNRNLKILMYIDCLVGEKSFCHQSYSIIDYELLGNDIDKGNYIVSDKMKEKSVERLKISFDAKNSE